VTLVPWANVPVQVVPQVMPAGDDVTVPLPVLVMVMVYVLMLKRASTVAADVIGTVQVLAVPVQPPPDQPANVDPELAAAVNTTLVPWLYVCEQSAPQVMPAGDEVTVPAPVPDLVTLSVYVLSVNVAVTLAAAVIVTEHVPLPVQAPPQPVKV